MNIQNLLKKLDKNTTPQNQNTNKQYPYKIKTIQSFGTLNSQPDQIQQSFVINDTTHNKSNFSGCSGFSKLDQELSEIDKMKQIYQRRQNKSWTKISNNQKSHSKSTQKHCLKPSNTPSFNKMTKLCQEKMKQSGCRNLYDQGLDQKADQCQKTDQCHARKKTFDHIYFKSDDLDESYEPREHNSADKDKLQINQLSEIKTPFNKNNDRVYARQIHDISNNLSDVTTPLKNDCNCEYQMSNVNYLIDTKFKQLENRIIALEKQNRNLKEYNISLQKRMQNIQELTSSIVAEKNQIKNKNNQLEEEKQELQSILKDVLYRREREKVISSKENTHRENDRKPLTIQSKNYSQRKIQPHQNKANFGGHKKTQSKMKVENLLQKLQIKIDRA